MFKNGGTIFSSISQISMKRKENIRKKTVIIAAVIVIFAYLVFVGVSVYVFNWNNALIRITTNFFPYPSAIAGGEIIKISELENRLSASKQFYSNQDFSELGVRIDFSTPEGKKRLKIKEKYILAKMIEDRIIEKESSRLGVGVSSAAVSEEVEKKLAAYGNRDEVAADIGRLYGWTLEDFKEKIVLPDMYQKALYGHILENDKRFLESRGKIDVALSELQKGKSFEEVVGNYSEGESVKNRGDLGWFRKEEILPEIAEVAFSLNKGERSEVLSSRLGYHIVRIEDKKEEDGEEKIKVRQIFVKNLSFADWLQEMEKKYKIYIPLKDYYWDEESDRVEFESEELRKFEENIDKNSPDDISVIF